MTSEEFKVILARGYERRGIEFKGPGNRTDRQLFAKVVRAVLGMANLRDGGTIIIGIEDLNRVITPIGVTPADLQSWNYDDVLTGISVYADPPVDVELERFSQDGKDFVIIRVDEFSETPVLCKKDYSDVLREGACYVRSRRKPETSEIPSYADMRDLMDLAIEKGIRRFYRQMQGAQAGARTDEEAFNAQLKPIK
jgi:predicted HTH transcriptional regulator